MGTILTIWLALMGTYYLSVAGMRLALKLPAAVTFVVCLPAMPFVVAYRNRVEHPGQARAIYILYGLLWAICILYGVLI